MLDRACPGALPRSVTGLHAALGLRLHARGENARGQRQQLVARTCRLHAVTGNACTLPSARTSLTS